jgi:polyisoprenoid-binding protein YceI
MKRVLFATAAVVLSVSLSAAALASDKFAFDPNHTNIIFHDNHFGFSSPSGHFGIKDGTLTLDEQDPAKSAVDVTIDTTSLVTGNPKFDEHIKSPDFIDAEKFPTATFKSTKVEVTGKDTAKVTGDLTLHGVTKPVTLDVKLNKEGEHPMTKKKAVGFSASATVKRSEFGIVKYVPDVADDVKIDIESEAQAM